MTVTIKDIAKELNVSYSAVSRALNQKSGVSEKTRNKILATAKSMGYQPNSLARGLVNKVSNTLGVIIPDILNPFFAEITKGIMETANNFGYDILLCVTGWDEKKEKEYIKTLQEKRVDGIILKSSKDKKNEHFDDIKVPYIILESWPTNRKCSYIEVDNEKGGYMAAMHLLDCGYKNIVFIGGKKESYSNRQRLEGLKKAFSERPEDIENFDTFYGSFGMSSGYELARHVFKTGKKIDAIFAGNDIIALGVLQYADELGLKIPEELGVIGFDNISYARLPQIQLTTIHQPKYALGKIVLETLVDEIKVKEHRIIKKITLEPDLIVRKTTKKIV